MLAPGAASGAAKRGPRRPACPPAHAIILAADPAAVVYETRRPPRNALADEVITEVACSRTTRKTDVLWKCTDLYCEGPARPDSLTLAGNILAYSLVQSSANRYGQGGPYAFWIETINLKTGRLLHRVPAGTSPPVGSGLVGNGYVRGLVAKDDGSVAWIAQDDLFEGAPGTYQVWAIDGTGQHLLAMGPQIVPYSIAVGRNTVYWTNNGIAELAPLG